MPSKIAIYNLVAGHLGQDEVLSFPAIGPLGDAIAMFWETARENTLRANTWHCARTRVTLAPTAVPPAFGYTNAFNLPGDFVRIVQVSISGFGDFRDYVREGRQLLSNFAPLNLVYVYDLKEVDYFDADLAMAFSLMIAGLAAEKVTGDGDLGQRLIQQFHDKYDDAAQADGMEDPPLQFAEDDWINARWNASYGPVAAGYQ
ncbi:hypothetical protein [Novosphingobium sp. FSW06-99]|uniref:hypothetical protein n=1 Tax=Novosphingobium sp. FSW06-99 TaxID=1739113 RepID=UPI00076BC4F3|nr:hypothetical protein [Novosphingobium sp. FSW06-99]KUR80910.1 hypothetical protein AQZ49_02485 [Novosphingobium sp. FSW06-99]